MVQFSGLMIFAGMEKSRWRGGDGTYLTYSPDLSYQPIPFPVKWWQTNVSSSSCKNQAKTILATLHTDFGILMSFRDIK